MNRKALLCLMAAAVLFQTAHSQTFKMNVGENEVDLWRFSSGQKETVKDSTVIGIGDTLYATADQEVAIQLESTSKLLVKGPAVLTFAGKDSKLDIVLNEGQVFLDRNEPHQFEELTLAVKGFSIVPLGTGVAVKTTRQGNPTTAVLKGQVEMMSPLGESITIGPRQFATVDPSGKLTSGGLNEKGLQQLEKWTGLRAESAQEKAVARAKEEPAEKAEDEAPAVVHTAAVVPNDTEPAPEEPKAEAPSAEEPEAAQAAPDTEEKKDEPAKVEKPAKKTSASAQPISAPPSPKQETESASETAETQEAPEAETESAASEGGLFQAPSYELGAGMATVNDEQWTRIALGIDVPIWKFGVFLDLELFLDADNQLSDKGWDFGDNWPDALARKIRYIRFGHENDPLYVKFGGLSDVTLGYGIIMDRFTNMLHYPDQKLLGLQFSLNDITPLGLTLQSVISDFAEAEEQGGIGALRLAVSPLKTTSIPLFKNLQVGATYALDRNVHAPAKKWTLSPEDALIKDLLLTEELQSSQDLIRTIIKKNSPDIDPDEFLRVLEEEEKIKNKVKPFDLAGLDVGLPIIQTPLLNMDLYGQAAVRLDDEEGWGMGAPGVQVEIWKLWGNLEYRRINGKFTSGFFDQYYLDERLSRETLESKADDLDSVTLNGVFGKIGADLSGFFTIEGSYQYLIGEDDKDQRYGLSGHLGEQIISRIPKVSVAEIYLRNSNIGTTPQYTKDGIPVLGTKAGLFHKTEYMYWGYKAGFEISSGATLLWDYRYGWQMKNGKLVSDNNMSLQTALQF
ncbi:MAG: hypothetical protein ACLFVQ_13805 [Chitinispirillaceae bacterium]